MAKQTLSLIDLLNHKTIHIDGSVELRCSGDRITVTLMSRPWWTAQHLPDADGIAEIDFVHVEDAIVPTGTVWSPLSLENFELYRREDVLTEEGLKGSIWCKGPIENPLLVYDAVSNVLATRPTVLNPNDVVNLFQSSWTAFRTADPHRMGYLLARVDEQLHDEIMRALNKQGITYTSHMPVERKRGDGVVALWGNGHIVAHDAIITFQT